MGSSGREASLATGGSNKKLPDRYVLGSPSGDTLCGAWEIELRRLIDHANVALMRQPAWKGFYRSVRQAQFSVTPLIR
jgi:hypothetical protein